jgi:aspartate/methionine/tyrosine aminotransferase
MLNNAAPGYARRPRHPISPRVPQRSAAGRPAADGRAAADGINLWLTVADEQVAMLTLAAHGVAVAPGAPFEVSPLGHDHVRVTVGLVRDGFEELADLLAEAAGTERPGSGRRDHAHPRGWR